MRRLGSCGIAVIALSFLLVCLGCGSGVTTPPAQVVIPAIVALTPVPDLALEIGGVATFTATAEDQGGTPLSPSPLISFVSTNPNVVQVAASGLACAGKWDSLTNPQICTPGPVGTAQVTATSAGVSSPPATVHVHQHIDSIAISEVPGQTVSADICKLGPTFPGAVGLSRTQSLNFQATAYNQAGGPAPGLDITSTVGPFSWTALNSSASVVILTTVGSGLQSGQVKAVANNPGMTGIFASISGVNSPPIQIVTCPVKSISLTVQNTDQTSIIEQNGSTTITATVTDSSDTQLTGISLLWSTSNASAFTAAGGTVASVRPGSATVIGSCTPPTCNFGFPSPRAIYPQNVITATGTGSANGAAATTSVWLASTECGVPDPVTQAVVNDDNCISAILPIDTATGITGVGVDLPVVPNSLQFDRQGARALLGTDSSRLGTVGLSLVTPASDTTTAPTVTPVAGAAGKILAVSPDSQKVIVSDTMDTPNQVFVVTSSATALPIVGATAAEFAPDSSKAYILAGNRLYIYSPTEALKNVSFPALGNAVTFLADGAFAYLGGGSSANKLTVLKTCDNGPGLDDGGSSEDVPLTFAPIFMKASPDNTKIFAVNTTGVESIDVTTMGKPSAGFPVTATAMGCAPPAPSATPPLPGGLPTVINQPGSSSNFGLGNLTPTQFIVASSGKRAYLLASNLNDIVVFNIDSGTTSTIQLSGNSVPLQASLSTDGKTLYVLAQDTMTNVSSVHALDTAINADTNQFTLSQSLCHAKTGISTTFTCRANLMAAKP